MLYKLIRDAHYAGAVSIHLSRASSNLSLSYFELCNNNYITSSDKSMMNRTLLHLLALSLSVLSTSSLQGPANRRLEFELAEYNSHRHWENGEEKDVYSPPTAGKFSRNVCSLSSSNEIIFSPLLLGVIV